MDFGIASVAAITVVAYLIGELAKASKLENKWIPIICGFTGLVLGIAAMFIMPDFPASDYITAAAVGIVSGLAATGIHEGISNLKNNDK
ncbi:MAG: phage holin family protein [Monoglobaceae bacterium]